MTISIHLLVALSLFGGANAFLTRAFSSATSLRASFVVEATVGTIYGTSSGSTEEVADMIVEALKDVAATPLNIDGQFSLLSEVHFAVSAQHGSTPPSSSFHHTCMLFVSLSLSLSLSLSHTLSLFVLLSFFSLLYFQT